MVVLKAILTRTSTLCRFRPITAQIIDVIRKECVCIRRDVRCNFSTKVLAAFHLSEMIEQTAEKCSCHLHLLEHLDQRIREHQPLSQNTSLGQNIIVREVEIGFRLHDQRPYSPA
jgi:hypothetical protein